jgi:putative ABC transport system ATP-binding protein
MIKLNDVAFCYGKNTIFEKLNYEFEKGKIYAIIGKSGAGKTTLLSVLSGLNAPTEGHITYNDMNLKDINKYVYRSKYIGVVFQNFNLLTKLTSLENVRLSMDIAGVKVKDKNEYAKNLLKEVGLNDEEINRRVLKLSGGQQQRVAIARALSYNPDIILADEPTGNLDSDTRNEIMNILKKLSEKGKCVIIVTHSPTVAKSADHVYEMKKN